MILSLDLGSTSFKAAVVDRRLRILGFHAHGIQHQFSAGGMVELNVAEAISAVCEAIKEAFGAAGIPGSRIGAVAVTSQAQTFTDVDRRGRPQTPFISWQDNRATQTCKRLKTSGAMSDFGQHCSFGSLLPALQLCQLRHRRETQNGFPGLTNLILGLPTFFIRQWTGAAVVDQNLAAMSGLYSLKLRTWWPVALRQCGLHRRQLPEVLPVGAVAGFTGQGALAFGLPAGIPVLLAGNDQTAGAYAARLDENHGLLVTLGTAQAAFLWKHKMPRYNSALIRGPFPGGGFYQMAADSCGGGIINWAKTILGRCETDEMFFGRATHSSRGAHGLVFDPGCDGNSAAWKNIGPHHTTADFARSVLEALAARMAELVQRLHVNLEDTKVLVAGGGSENPLWVRIVSETLGTRLKVIEGRPCVGAARMALSAIADDK